MVRVITQDTFDSVVKENIEDLEMGRKEAVEDAREQFVAQGVDLSNIVISDGADIPLTIKELQDLFADDGKCKDVKASASLCDTLATECRKGLAERVLATERAAYPAITRVLQIEDSAPSEDAKAARLSAMRAMGALMETNPDVLEGQGCKELFSGLGSGERAMEEASLEALLNCCVRHEHNRVNLVRNNLLDLLDTLSEGHPVRVSRVWQALVQDDDVRVPFGKAHDHARAIVEDHEALRKLCAAIQSGEFSYSEQTLLLSVLGSLTVRNEYCQAVVDQGMLKAILDLLSKEGQDRSIIKESLKLLKVLAGNDNVKNEIAALNGFAPVINSILNNLVRAIPKTPRILKKSLLSQYFVLFFFVTMLFRSAVCQVRVPRRLRRDSRGDAAEPRQREAGDGGRRRGPHHAGHEDPRQRAGHPGECEGDLSTPFSTALLETSTFDPVTDSSCTA